MTDLDSLCQRGREPAESRILLRIMCLVSLSCEAVYRRTFASMIRPKEANPAKKAPA